MTQTSLPGSCSLLGIDPANHEPHALHASERAYPETNCYADILIELLHARGVEPLAALGCSIRGDFEGDQFTFLKPPLNELDALFGIDVHEMQPYRCLARQAQEQLALDRTLIVELDAFYLPDTAATTYRREHVKTSVAIESIDLAEARLRYFHNAGIYDLAGDDFRNVFRLADSVDARTLPPYVELVRFRAAPRLVGKHLKNAARDLLEDHLARRPDTNPFERFGEHLREQMPALVEGGRASFHAYAFATVRMAGAGSEVAATYLDWLLAARGAAAATAFRAVARDCKTLSFKLARGRVFDTAAASSRLAAGWTEAQKQLDVAVH